VAHPRDPLTVVVLAAGLGKRMRSKKIKLLHDVAGRPMVARVTEIVRALRPRYLRVVVGHQADLVKGALDGLCDDFVLQKEQRGTGHAVLQAMPGLKFSARAQLLIVNGDLPTLRGSTLRGLLGRHKRSGAAMTLLTARLDNPSGYGRIVRDPSRGVVRIVEDRDASPEERKIYEVNCGIYCADPVRLLRVLERLRPNNVQGEFYLTDAVHELVAAGEKVVALCHGDADEVLGVNDREELARASRTLFARKAEALQASGVTILDTDRVWIDPAAKVGRDSVFYPDVIVEGACTIGQDCIIRPGCRIVDSRIGSRVEIKDHSVVLESVVADGAQVGPFAHLRPGSRLDADVKVGNFVEVKKTRLRAGVKAPHLSYLGDADVGEHSNIGAGTITCNYDGEKKHRTVLGKGVFVGSDTQLVAPVNVGKNAYIGAGSTVTQDVPDGALAVSRARQKNIEGWVEERQNRKNRGSARSRKKR
jgi:bifunctional UDP-N-acetylglucosamine pyrophosphorylase/glucosamine-1-phosphate N-acetyltransferase